MIRGSITGVAYAAAILLALTGCGITGEAGPTFVAHRGGALVYPESSLEAFEAVANTEFPLEMDLRQLADGTLVPQHDPTVDRTLIGLSGPIEKITPSQWAGARIEHPSGGKSGTPTTWNEVLVRFGDKHLLVPELKAGADTDRFVESVLSKDLQDSVIAQSFDYQVCQQMADAGLMVLYLLSENEIPDSNEIIRHGISHVGPPAGIPAEQLSELTESDLTVWPYTVNKVETARELLDAGVDGMFTDDPWHLADSID